MSGRTIHRHIGAHTCADVTLPIHPQLVELKGGRFSAHAEWVEADGTRLSLRAYTRGAEDVEWSLYAAPGENERLVGWGTL